MSPLQHCQGEVCARRGARLCCGCRCPLCVATTDVGTRAATLPHCDGLRCSQRVAPPEQRPPTYPPYPACSCGCERCHAVAVACGLRPQIPSAGPPYLGPAPATLADPSPDPWAADVPDPWAAAPTPTEDPRVGELGAALVAESRAWADAHEPPPDIEPAAGLHDPPTTGSRIGLAYSCAYWLRADAVEDPVDANDLAAAGTLAHRAVELHRRGLLTPAAYASLEGQVASERRDRWAASVAHARRWLDAHPGTWARTEVPVAYDYATGLGLELQAYLDALGVSVQRGYALPGVWPRLREAAGLSPLAVPATVDLVLEEHGVLTVVDWCFGRTDKRGQLDHAAITFAELCHADTVRTLALYVDEEGVREVERVLDAAALDAAAAQGAALLRAASTAQPIPGTHCREAHCRHVAHCPATQAALVSLLRKPAGADPRELFAPQILDMDHATQLLYQLDLVEAAARQVDAALRVYADEHGGILTKPGFIWRAVKRRGVPRFAKSLAEAWIRAHGGSAEDVDSCHVVGADSTSYRETRAPKEKETA